MRTHIQKTYNEAGIRIILKKTVAEIKKNKAQYHLTFNDGSTYMTDMVMAATGRNPNTKNLGLEKCGVSTNEKGAIIVDKNFQTNINGIYAIGDVTDRVNLTPVAIREGMAFAETNFHRKTQYVDYDTIPTAVFSNPEIGTVGLTEKQAQEKYHQCDIYETIFPPLKHSLAKDKARIYMKLVATAKEEKIVGAHIMGDGAAEMAQLLAIPMKMGATKKDFDATMALHPTSAEELVTMRKKAQ